MTQLLGKDLLTRANAALLLGLVGGGLALCVLAAMIHDVGRVLALW
jgi:hypothetical protein